MNYVRYRQQVEQIRRRVQTGSGNVVVYGGRDEVTGLRRVETADGGVGLGRYLSNSVPDGVLPMAEFGTIGLVGFLDRKPG